MTINLYASYLELIVTYAPKLLGVAITLIFGWILGHVLGFTVSKLIKKIGVEKPFQKTLLGKMLEGSKITLEHFIDQLIRWIIYICAVLVSIDLLEIRILDAFLNATFNYLPSLLGGTLTIIVGLILVDALVILIKQTTLKLNIKFVAIIMFGIRLMLYFVVVVIGLSVMRIEVEILYIIANAVAMGVAIGISAGLGIAIGWGLKDLFAKNAEKIVRESIKTFDEANDLLEVKELKETIRTLEEKLRQRDAEIRGLHSIRMDLIEDLSAPIEDAYDKLHELVDGKGITTALSNGFKITVLDPTLFPWFEVMVFLRVNNYDIWVTTENDKLVIKSKLASG